MNAINTDLKKQIQNRPFGLQTKRLPVPKTKSTSCPQSDGQNDLIDEYTNYEESLLREMLYFDRF